LSSPEPRSKAIVIFERAGGDADADEADDQQEMNLLWLLFMYFL